MKHRHTRFCFHKQRTGTNPGCFKLLLGVVLMCASAQAPAVVATATVLIDKDVAEQLRNGTLSVNDLGLVPDQKRSTSPVIVDAQVEDDDSPVFGNANGNGNYNGNYNGNNNANGTRDASIGSDTGIDPTGKVPVTFSVEFPTNDAGGTPYQSVEILGPDGNFLAKILYGADGVLRQIPRVPVFNTQPNLTGRFNPNNVADSLKWGDPDFTAKMEFYFGDYLEDLAFFSVPPDDDVAFSGQATYDPDQTVSDLTNQLGSGSVVEKDSCPEGQPFGLTPERLLAVFVRTSRADGTERWDDLPPLVDEFGDDLDTTRDIISWKFRDLFNVTRGWSSKTFLTPLREPGIADMEIFSDGFESGDTASWSSQQP